MKYFLAIDIGASSGRHIIGYKNSEGLIVNEEIYRFPNFLNTVDNHLCWDVDRLFSEVKKGIKIAISKFGKIESLAIDTWGVDYVLMKDDQEIFPVYAYRDSRTEEVINEVHSIIPFEKLYEITGSQFQKFNTIYQLYKDKIDHRLDNATDFLMIPEYLSYKLTGIKKKEYTNASTTGMCDLKTNDFSLKIAAELGLNSNLFKKLEKPGTFIGPLKKEIQEEVGGNIDVVFCCSHDTASAVEGIDIKENAPYISSGTWSLLGIKEKNGINSQEGLEANYSNEYGPDYVRVQKNIMGLWIIQELSKEMNLTFVEMVEKAKYSGFAGIFDVNDSIFLTTGNMKERIIEWFKSRNLEYPLNDNDLISSTYHSLAYSYKVALDELEKIMNKKFNYLYIVGGGAKNQFLNDLTAKYSKKIVDAQPIEATAIGNILIQMRRKI